MPEEATLDEISEAYMDSWKLMLKATALYRDGSKLSQPLTNAGDSDSVYSELFDFSDEEEAVVEQKQEVEPEQVQQALYGDSTKPYRRRLPTERQSITHKFDVGGHEGYITVGLYEDGTPGEVFITMSKEGSTLSGITNALSILLSISLQYGVPIEAVVKKFSHVRFEPSGITSNPEIPVAKSLVDYIARWMGLKFLDKDQAKMYHTSELVDKAYDKGGSNFALHIPVEKDKAESGLIKFNKSKADVVVHQAESAQEHSSYDADEGAKDDATINVGNISDFAMKQGQLALKQNNEDAPMCSECGSVTLRNGACYKCPNCGSTTGCS